MTPTQEKHRLEGYTAAMFRNYLGQEFVFRLPQQAVAVCGETLRLTLVQVHEDEKVVASAALRSQRLGKPLRSPFSILFRAAEETRLSSGTPVIEHPDFEPFPLFMSRVQLLPGDVDEDHLPHFEIVFG